MTLCDFGLARVLPEKTLQSLDSEQNLSDCVVTRCYRPPELVLCNKEYDLKVDVWSLGCVFAEVFLGELLFKAHNSKDLLMQILNTVEGFEELDLEFVEDSDAKQFLRGFEGRQPFKMRETFKDTIIDAAGRDIRYERGWKWSHKSDIRLR